MVVLQKLKYSFMSYKKNLKIIAIIFIGIVMLQYVFNILVYLKVSANVNYKFRNSDKDVHKDIKYANIRKMTNTGEIQEQATKDKEGLFGSIYQAVISYVVAFFGPPTPVKLPMCPNETHIKGGPIRVLQANFKEEELYNLNSNFSSVHSGGRWHPTHCKARDKVAILVPYRDRERELGIFLRHMHPFLQRQNLDYGIFVIEQSSMSLFNRGLMLNIGFVEAMKESDYDCVVLHDVDMLPEDDRILYTCPPQPRHLVAAGSKWGYRLPYKGFLGGVAVFSSKHYRTINGFSNVYFGWGAEDDDLNRRVRKSGLNIIRYPVSIGRYNVLKHKTATRSKDKGIHLKKASTRFKFDGLNDLQHLNYTIVDEEDRPLYSWFLVEVDSTTVVTHIQEKAGYNVTSLRQQSLKKRKPVRSKTLKQGKRYSNINRKKNERYLKRKQRIAVRKGRQNKTQTI